MGFFGSMKDAVIFWVAKKTQEFFWVFYFSSAQINKNISAIRCWCGIFWGMLKMPTTTFFGKTNSEVGIFGVKNMNLC